MRARQCRCSACTDKRQRVQPSYIIYYARVKKADVRCDTSQTYRAAMPEKVRRADILLRDLLQDGHTRSIEAENAQRCFGAMPALKPFTRYSSLCRSARFCAWQKAIRLPQI